MLWQLPFGIHECARPTVTVLPSARAQSSSLRILVTTAAYYLARSPISVRSMVYDLHRAVSTLAPKLVPDAAILPCKCVD